MTLYLFRLKISEMKTVLITARRAMITILLLAMFMPLSSQEVALDLEMVYKIRAGGSAQFRH